MEALTQDLFEASDKDVIFKLSDGEETAHKAVLAASSDVFKTMLSHDMRERDGTVELQDVDKVTTRVFLGLLYTGRICAEDWSGEECATPANLGEATDDVAISPPLDVLMPVLAHFSRIDFPPLLRKGGKWILEKQSKSSPIKK